MRRAKTNMITEIQAEIAAILAAVPYFSDVPILSQVKGDLASEVDIALEKGLCVIITTPTADVDPSMQVPGPYYKEVSIVIQVWDNPTLNGTSKVGVAIAEQILGTLHWYTLQTTGNILQAERPSLVPFVPDESDPSLTGWLVRLNTSSQWPLAPLPQLDDLPISQSDNVVSIGSQVGATVIYTTDGKKPSPRNGTVYGGPITVDSGTEVRARAWCWGYLPSDVAKIVVS